MVPSILSGSERRKAGSGSAPSRADGSSSTPPSCSPPLRCWRSASCCSSERTGVSMNGFDHWVLTGAIFIPGIGAVVCMLWPKTDELGVKTFALLTSLVALGFGVYVFAHFNYDHT